MLRALTIKWCLKGAQEPNEPYDYGTSFYTIINVIPDRGDVRANNDQLEVRDAQSVVIYITCATDYNRASPLEALSDEWKARAEDTLAAVSAKKAGMPFIRPRLLICPV